MKIKKIVCAGLAATLLVSASLTGCSGGAGTPAAKDTDTVNLVYYTPGTPDTDIKKVTDAINQKLKSKINVTIQYNKIAFGDYSTKTSALINSGSDFDILFSAEPDYNYVSNANKGAWLDLTPYLSKEGKEMYSTIDSKLWDAAKVNGKIYGVPTQKEISTPEWFTYDKDLLTKYNIDYTKLTTLDSLEPVFATIKKSEPDYTMMQLNKDSTGYDLFALDGYEHILNAEIPLMVKSDDSNLKVVNVFSTDYAKKLLSTLRKFNKAGYINEDAPVKTFGSDQGKKIFFIEADSGPLSDSTWTSSRGYTVVSKQVSPAYVTNVSSRGSLMAVNSRTKHPEACVKFLNLLNTDPEIRNMFAFGIEGQHYKLTSDGQVNLIDKKDYSGIAWTQGNWFLLKTKTDEPKDKWDQFKTFNNQAIKSKMLGFNADTSSMTTQIAAITQVWSKYFPSLMTGSVDPDTELPKFLSELKSAGIDQMQAELQKQLDSWKAGNK
jgi:putative aldouronate transport system substrate-binding protein